MHRIAVISFLFLLSSPVLIKTAVLSWFMWNKAEIIAEQCINRDKRENKCNGKCYLTKQLKKIDNPGHNQEPALPVRLWEKAETSLFILPEGQDLVARPILADQFALRTFRSELLPDQMVLRQIFKPPA
jgi:hypothetical protein